MTGPLHRYPLPAHNIPHDEPDCGNPDWCLHEEPTERADLRIEVERIPFATAPLVVFSPAVADIGERLAVDTEGMSHYLQRRAGWSALDAAGVRVAFESREEFAERRDLPDAVEGVHSDFGIDRPAGGSEEDGEVLYRNNITIPISEDVLAFAGIRKLNHILRHELGHGDSAGRYGDVRLYRELLRKQGAAASGQGAGEPKLFGRIPASNIAEIAEAVGVSGLWVLHVLDREEAHARMFSWRHALRLNPISRAS